MTRYSNLSLCSYVLEKVVRLIPLQYSFFPNPDELKKNIQDIIFDKFGYKPLEIQTASTAISETHTDAHLKRSLEESSASEDVSLVEDDPAIHQDKRLREDETVVAGSTAASLPVADMTVTAEQQTVEKQQSCEKVASVDSEPPVEHAGSADEAKDSEARGDGEASAPKSYSISFKARNHDTLTRALATSTIQGSLPKTSKYLKYNSEVGEIASISWRQRFIGCRYKRLDFLGVSRGSEAHSKSGYR